MREDLSALARSTGAALACGLRTVANLLYAASWWLEQRCGGAAR